MLGYLRARLHRRLFLMFGFTIFCTAAAAGVVFLAFGDPGWAGQVEGAERFVGHRFERAWDDPGERETLARDLAEDLRARVQVFDARGRLVHTFGPTACRHEHTIAIERPTGSLGSVAVCLPHTGGHPGTAALVFAVTAAILWLASGAVALRMTRPLAQLVRVARDIGDGKLDSRMGLGPMGSGEFRLIAEAVDDMATRIEKQIGDQRELLAAVSHEIRTPLGHLRVLLELLRDSGSDPAMVTEVEREVLAIDEMVGQLLASSRVDFGTVDRRPLEGTALAIRAIERADLDPTLLSVDVEDTTFAGDAALVLQALANLLRNAADHGGGATSLVISGDATHVRFEVGDEGAGFLDDDLPAAFDSFQRGRGRGGGSLGLGLSLVKRIALAHGGEVWARNGRPGAVVGFSVRRTEREP